MAYEPAYLSHSETLKDRAAKALELLDSCAVCPRRCGVDRSTGHNGFCQTSRTACVASICDHHGEEPVISGTRGAGTIFFAGCNMGCLYCQNWQISQPSGGSAFRPYDAGSLAAAMLRLQNECGVHNIEFVSPSHVVPHILEALSLAVPEGLRLPLVYNSNGYDSCQSLALLDGVIDIYLPDFKYADTADQLGVALSQTPQYRMYAEAALLEMWRQAGPLELDEAGVAMRGMIVRHLVLPDQSASTTAALRWLRHNLGRRVAISLMSQYHPDFRALSHPTLGRRLDKREYEDACRVLDELEFETVFIQPFEENAAESYRPDFEREDHPFAQHGPRR